MARSEHDRGPSARFARHFAGLPDCSGAAEHFWLDWGPVFYRGRLDGSARLLCIASDPGATERVAGRVLVGDAGQLVQGFLARAGLTRSYLLLNAFPYAFHPSHGPRAPELLREPGALAWRNRLYDIARRPKVVAVVAFGRVAAEAVRLWPGRKGLAALEVPHPSSRDVRKLLASWAAALETLRGFVPPDADAEAEPPAYGTEIDEACYRPIPRRDLPFGAPPFLGDDSALRAAGKRRSSVRRPDPDDGHTLIWTCPGG